MSYSKPNILIILTDQQSHFLMSCAGTSWLSTPHLDRLAVGGVRFTRAYCSNPVCVPSRFSMFTGRMPSSVGMRGNGGKNLHAFSAAEDETGLGHCLRRVGYATWYGGKVHLPIGLTPERLGFTTFTVDERERLAVEAADLIHRQGAQPWAMVVSLINPHDLCLHAIKSFAQEGSWDRSLVDHAHIECANVDEILRVPDGIDPESWWRERLPPLPANWDIQSDEPELVRTVLKRRPFKLAARERWGEREWRLHRYVYARLAERVDREIGVVLDALAASGQADDTLVVMTSDHGDHDSSHRLEHKTFFYEEAARVPWLMRLPGRIPAGRVVDQAVVATGLDLLATCCDYAGVPQPAACLGLSQRAAAEGLSDASLRDAAYGENLVSRMIVTQAWKYVRYDEGAHAEQLYDLVRDPGETRNHAGDSVHAEILVELRRRLDAEMAAHAAVALGPIVPDQAGE